MRFTQIVAPTIKALFVQRMEDLILSGELQCGERLPSERELAEQMKISKTAVHDGVCDLVRMGFLEVVPRRGVYVGDYTQNGTLEALTAIMQHSGGTLDARNVQSMMEMRCAIEGVAIEGVIRRGDPAVLAKLRGMADEALRLIENTGQVDYDALGNLYFRFHHFVCVASGNTIAPLIFNAFRVPSTAFWINSARALGPVESVRRLTRFADCIEEGDLSGACAHLREISDNAVEIVRGE